MDSAGTVTGYYGGEDYIVLLGKGCCEQQAAAHAYRCAGKDIPHVVTAGMHPTPCNITADKVSRYTPLPTLAFLQEGGSGK